MYTMQAKSPPTQNGSTGFDYCVGVDSVEPTVVISKEAAPAGSQEQQAVLSEEVGTREAETDDPNNNLYTNRPIVVGYAFGPKKMSTMGVVMAEASKAKLSTAAYMSGGPPERTNKSNHFLTESSLLCHHHHEGGTESSAYYHQVSSNSPSSSNNTNNIVFTIDKDNGDNDGSLRNIVRHFRSSCSSVGSVSTGITTGTACSTVPSTVTLSAATIASTDGSSSFQSKLVPVGVSFVPLDPGKERATGKCARQRYALYLPNTRPLNFFLLF